jgi:cytochrome c oxidase subunit II
MDKSFRLFPEQASTFAERVDTLYWFLVAVSGFFSALVVVLIVYFAVKYRRRPGIVPENTRTVLSLEILWTVVPLILVSVMFSWGAVLFMDQTVPPEGAQQVYVVGRQWMWKIQHANGRREINELHVPVGQPIKITLASEDVIHSFFVPAFRVKADAIPGQYRTLWFEATKPGQYHLFCAEYCGTNHSKMIGRVVVLSGIDYQDWLAGGPSPIPMTQGERLFGELECSSCHPADGGGRGPALHGRYGTQSVLADGSRTDFDDTYVRESILDPSQKVAMGYPPAMPSYRGRITEEQILALVAYIKSVSSPAQSTQPAGGANPR